MDWALLTTGCFDVSVSSRWPIAVAASCAIGEDDRAAARAAMDTRRGLSYFDLAAGWVVVNEVWRRRDAGDAWCSWRSVNGRNGGLLLL